jgi:hypothetical protein
MSLPLTLLLFQSCALKDSQSDLNKSALYDPPTLTLIEGREYQFVEGRLVGRKNHKWHSDYSYRRAIVIGTGDK